MMSMVRFSVPSSQWCFVGELGGPLDTKGVHTLPCTCYDSSPLPTTILHLHTRCSFTFSSRVEVSSIIIPPIGAILEVETKNSWSVVGGLLECNCLLKMISHVLSLAILSKCHIVTTKKNEPKKIDCNCWHHSQLHLIL